MISLYPPSYYDAYGAAEAGKIYGDSGVGFSAEQFDTGEAKECLGFVCVEFIDSKQHFATSNFQTGAIGAAVSGHASAHAKNLNEAFVNQRAFAKAKGFGVDYLDGKYGYGNVYGGFGQYYYPPGYGAGYSEVATLGAGLGKKGYSTSFVNEAARAAALKYLTLQENNLAAKYYFKQATKAHADTAVKGYNAVGQQCKKYQCFHKYRNAGAFNFGPSYYGVYGKDAYGKQAVGGYGGGYGAGGVGYGVGGKGIYKK